MGLFLTMIRISLGKLGSGKTACEVREMALCRTNRQYYSNIKTDIKSNKVISSDMIVKKELVGSKKKKNGDEDPIYEYKVNVDFWKKKKGNVSVIIDEAHTVMNSRRSMHKANILITEWLALLRRVLGESESGVGELVLITQLPYRLDNIARDMATEFRHHICHYSKMCIYCGTVWDENSEMPERLFTCPSCGNYKLKKYNHRIEVRHFSTLQDYENWNMMGMKTFYKWYIVSDIEDYFPLYDTLQWDNMFNNIY